MSSTFEVMGLAHDLRVFSETESVRIHSLFSSSFHLSSIQSQRVLLSPSSSSSSSSSSLSASLLTNTRLQLQSFQLNLHSDLCLPLDHHLKYHLELLIRLLAHTLILTISTSFPLKHHSNSPPKDLHLNIYCSYDHGTNQFSLWC